MKTEFYLFRLPAKQVSTIPNATLCMYSTPAQPILPYAFKPRNYVIRFYSVFIPFVHPQVFPVKFFKRFTRFSPIFPNFLSYNQLYIYIYTYNKRFSCSKKFLGHNLSLMQNYIPFSGVRLYVFILYNLFYINHES